MIEALVSWLIATFLLGPLQADLAERLDAARAPAAVVQQVARCAGEAAPLLVERAAADPVWAVGTVLRVWVGAASPESVLGEATPGCASALDAARPFMG